MKKVKINVPKANPLEFLRQIPKDKLKSAAIYIHNGVKDAFLEAVFEEGGYALSIADVKMRVNSEEEDETWVCLYCMVQRNDTLYSLSKDPLYNYFVYAE